MLRLWIIVLATIAVALAGCTSAPASSPVPVEQLVPRELRGVELEVTVVPDEFFDVARENMNPSMLFVLDRYGKQFAEHVEQVRATDPASNIPVSIYATRIQGVTGRQTSDAFREFWAGLPSPPAITEVQFRDKAFVKVSDSFYTYASSDTYYEISYRELDKDGFIIKDGVIDASLLADIAGSLP